MIVINSHPTLQSYEKNPTDYKFIRSFYLLIVKNIKATILVHII